MYLMYAALIVAVCFAGWRVWRRLRYFLHTMQLEGYKVGEFMTWIRSASDRPLLRLSHVLGASTLAIAIAVAATSRPALVATLLALTWSVLFASSRRYRSDSAKKPLVFTPRLRRLLAVSTLFAVAPIVVGLLVNVGAAPQRVFAVLAGFLAADLLAPLWVVLAALLLSPVERAFQNGFKVKAKRALAARPDLVVVAVTGSYGKTSVKFAIAEILRQRFNVLATPGSYNTPMGICKVVNNDLRSDHQVLVLEMGARYPGDIQELCDLVRPDVAVITNVGVAHLETMGSVDAIAVEKGTLARCVKDGGTIILNADDGRVAAMTRNGNAAVVSVAIDQQETAELVAGDISHDLDGASFTVRDRDGGTALFKTQLIGRHNIMNILLGVAVGRVLGLRLRPMAHAIARLEPVDHRLQLRRQGDVVILDDAFNSNPVGARNAVEVLGQFRSGQRIIVTPGMIELGPLQEEENRRFGEHIAGNADLAVLVGPRQTEPILAGLLDHGFPEDSVKVVRSLDEARQFLHDVVRPGDVILYENDLPDQYEEAA